MSFVVDPILIARDGTNQLERLLDGLKPSWFQIDERKLEDWLRFVHQMAGEIHYYNLNNVPSSDWQAYFKEFSEAEIGTFLQQLEQKEDHLPHFALLLAFLKLLTFVQEDLNALKEKHLEFYYKKVLGFDVKAPTADKVHLLFELTKNTLDAIRLEKDSALRAGKDVSGAERIYTTDKEVVLNNAKITSLKTIFVDTEYQHRIYAAPVANSKDGHGEPLEKETPHWSTFGEKQFGLAEEERSMPDARVGFAIASPILFLKEGTRQVTLTINFQQTITHLNSDDLIESFQVLASGEEDWIDLGKVSPNIVGTNMLELFLIIPAETPAILNYIKVSGAPILDTDLPVLQFILNHANPTFLYEELSQLEIVNIQIDVSAIGVRDLVVQNENGVLDASQAFFPFGNTPVIGSPFYIGSQEIFQKELDSLEINLDWLDLPNGGISSIYEFYGTPYSSLTNSSFKATVHYLNKYRWQSNSSTIEIFSNNSESLGILSGISHQSNIAEFDSYSNTVERGFIRLSLSGSDFGHRVFPNIFAAAAITAPNSLPSQPYTPKLRTLSLSYTCSTLIEITEPSTHDKLFHIAPFGGQTIKDNSNAFLLPQYPQGTLYLGINNLKPPQNLSILFQLLEGSADPDVDVRQEDVRWSYLGKEGWVDLVGANILSDTTEGLQTSGIIEFNIGRNASLEDPLLPINQHWLRARLDKNPAGIGRMIGIHAQAVTATFEDRNNATQHLEQPLPEETIKKLARNITGIKSIFQPAASFGNRAAENKQNFFIRVSERLRHKQRSITLWDYERLILERFPSIFKVKCVNHSDLENGFAPGHVCLVVIPNLINQNAVNPLQPKVSTLLRNQIANYIKQFTPFFTTVRVENARFEPLQVEMKVGLKSGFDGGFYGDLLNQELQRFLSPWAFEEGEDIVFGGRIYKSHILTFVERRPYVDYVTDFKLIHFNAGPGIGDMCIDGDLIEGDFIVQGLGGGLEVSLAAASTAKSIIVSVNNHHISIISPNEVVCSVQGLGEGIGNMYVEVNFEVDN